ncbi:hypothetical protein LINGRAHAP2_LOCUS8119 [Linum grandiflorum]
MNLQVVRDIVTSASSRYAFVGFETEREMHRAYKVGLPIYLTYLTISHL